jgi:hypothetical protein
MPWIRASWAGFFEIFIEIALGSTVVVLAVVVVVVVVVDSPVVDVEVDAVVVAGRFDAPLPAPVVFAVAPAARAVDPVALVAPPAAAPPPLALPAPVTADPPAFGAGELTFGDEVGALPAPRPCAAVVVPSATVVTAVNARSENLRIIWSLRRASRSKKDACRGLHFRERFCRE